MDKPPPKIERGPKRWKKAYNDLLDYCVRSRLVSVMGGFLNETPHGQALDLSAYAALNTERWHPFKVRDNSSAANGLSVYVDGNSDLWKTFGTKQTITGLGLAGAVSVSVGDLIWLSIGVTSQNDVTADGASIEVDTPWDGHPNPIILTTDGDGTYQTDYNQIIAEVVATTDLREGLIISDGTNSAKIIEHLPTALICTTWMVDGRWCLVPQPIVL